MHYVRSLVMHHMGSVAYILGNQDKQAECYAAQQKDAQYMVKTLPHHPFGYSLYCRCCMNFQQMSAAKAFLGKGLAVAREVNDDASLAAMCYQRAVAVVLGGPSSSSPLVDFDCDEVLQLMAEGESARASVLSWFPAPWSQHVIDGEPDRSLLHQRLLPELAQRNNGAVLTPGGKLPVLTGLLYVTKPPSSIPAGAVLAE